MLGFSSAELCGRKAVCLRMKLKAAMSGPQGPPCMRRMSLLGRFDIDSSMGRMSGMIQQTHQASSTHASFWRNKFLQVWSRLAADHSKGTFKKRSVLELACLMPVSLNINATRLWPSCNSLLQIKWGNKNTFWIHNLYFNLSRATTCGNLMMWWRRVKVYSPQCHIEPPKQVTDARVKLGQDYPK